MELDVDGHAEHSSCITAVPMEWLPCYRYSPLLSDENKMIADLLVGLTDARKTWGFGLCFLHLRNVQGH